MLHNRCKMMFVSLGKLTADTMLLTLEAQAVIGLRLGLMSLGGPRAQVEAQRMVTEKVLALVEAASTLALGGSAHKVIRGYWRHNQSQCPTPQALDAGANIQ